MGREIKRVPLDFHAPEDQTWEGYVLPDRLRGDDCPDCQGGQTHAGWWLQRMCQRISMLAADIGGQEHGRPLHPWLAQDPYPHTDSRHLFDRATRVIRPSEDMATLVAALADRNEDDVKSSFGSFDYAIYRAIVTAAGLPEWGSCATCEGHGTVESYPGQRAEAEAWERYEPPTGEGWQLWQTVSDAPMSPVFATADELIDWMTTPAAEWGASGPWSRENAEAFVRGPGWAPTFVSGVVPGMVVDGVTAVTS
jgi:hypothetical protein